MPYLVDNFLNGAGCIIEDRAFKTALPDIGARVPGLINAFEKAAVNIAIDIRISLNPLSPKLVLVE